MRRYREFLCLLLMVVLTVSTLAAPSYAADAPACAHPIVDSCDCAHDGAACATECAQTCHHLAAPTAPGEATRAACTDRPITLAASPPASPALPPETTPPRIVG